MAYTNLINDIKAVIKNNGNQEITGQVLQTALVEMVNELGSGYTYKGVATLSTTPDVTTPNIFYLLGEVGTYTNIGGLQHANGIGIALWNGSAWSYQNVPSSAIVATDATPTEGSANPVQSGGVAENCVVDAKRFIVNSEQLIPYTIKVRETIIVRIEKSTGYTTSAALYARQAESTGLQTIIRSLAYVDEIEFTAATNYNYLFFTGSGIENGVVVDIVRKGKLWQNVKDNSNLTRYLNPSYPCFTAKGADHSDSGRLYFTLYPSDSVGRFSSDIYKAFRSLHLKGFDSTKQYCVTLFRVGFGSTQNDYQIRLKELSGSTLINEVYFPITLSNIAVVGGVNHITSTSTDGTHFLDAVIDYSCVPANSSANLNSADYTKFVISAECFEKTLADIEEELNDLEEAALTDEDLTISVVSNNIADPSGILLNKIVRSDGKIYDNDSWDVYEMPVVAGTTYTIGGFYLGRSGYYSFYNGTTLLSHANFADPNGRTTPLTITAPENATLLYFDIKSGSSPTDPYSGLQVNIGNTFLDYDIYELGLTAIKGYPIEGGSGSVQDLSTLIQDLPVSADGGGIQTGYAYINSTTGAVIVKQ